MMEARVSGNASAEEGCGEFIQRRQRPPDETKEEFDREIGEVRPIKFRHQMTGQDQRLHSPFRYS
jgi:hypothetical protein